jgi:predicted MFS family arabinose efflux permease
MADPNPNEKTPPPAGGHSDPRLWPVATVMATGIFATTFVQLQGLGSLPFMHLLMKRMGMDSDTAATFFALAMLPWTFKTIAGLLVDGVPLFGSRRRGYLLLSALTAAGLWLLMGLSPDTWRQMGLSPDNYYNALLALAIGMNLAIVFGSTTSGGLLVEAGQRFGVSGRLSSLRVAAQNLGAALGLWLGGQLAEKQLGWTSAAAIAPLLLMFLSAWFLLKEPPAPARIPHGRSVVKQLLHVSRSIGQQIKNVLRREMLLPAALLFFIQVVPTFRSTCLYEYQTKTLNYSDAALGTLGLAGDGVALLSSVVYAWWCRQVSLRVSLYCGILLVALSALPYLFYAAYTPYMPRALAIEGSGTFLQFLAYLPLFDLAVRSTPKGSEALGYSLLISVWNIGLAIGSKTGPMLYQRVLHQDLNRLIWINAGVTLAGVIFVFLLPRALVEKSEGE